MSAPVSIAENYAPIRGRTGALRELQAWAAAVARAVFPVGTVKGLMREFGLSAAQAKEVVAGRATAWVAVEMLRRWSPAAWNDAIWGAIQELEGEIGAAPTRRDSPDHRRAVAHLESARAHQAAAARLLGSTYDAV